MGKYYRVNRIVGYILSVCSLFVIVIALIFKKIRREWWVLLLSFLGMVALLRYIHAPLFESYLMFILPFVLLFTALLLFLITKHHKIIGIILIGIVVGFSLQKTGIDIKNSRNEMRNRTAFWTKLLQHSYPNKKFALYDYRYKSAGYSVPLVMYMQYNNLLDSNGYKIGFGKPSKKDDPKNFNSFMEIKRNIRCFNLMDLNSSTSAQLASTNWNPINPKFIYQSTEEWYVNK